MDNAAAAGEDQDEVPPMFPALAFLVLTGCRAQRPDETGKDSADTADTSDTSDTSGEDLGDLAVWLTRTGGCADLLVYAVSEDGRYALTVHADGLLALTPDGTVESYAYDATDAMVEVELSVGTNVASDPCNDAPFGEVEDTLLATAGSLSFSIDELDPEDARADVFGSDLELASGATGTRASVSEVSILDAHVGWLPG